MGASKMEWRDETVTSLDGTVIAFLTVGSGPGLLVIPGNNRLARHYADLATSLSDTFTVHVVERRGRGDSGPQGPAYNLESEVEDALSVMLRTDAHLVFGHSYGGLIGLHVALRTPVSALIVYEPGVSIDGSFDIRWLPSFARLLVRGRRAAAMAVFLKGTRLAPIGNAPMILYRALALLLLSGAEGRDTRDMMATTPAEIGEIARLDSDGARYERVTSPTLLIGGQKSPSYLTGVLPRLASIIPDARYVILPNLDHNAPDLNAVLEVDAQIRAFTETRLGRDRPQ